MSDHGNKRTEDRQKAPLENACLTKNRPGVRESRNRIRSFDTGAIWSQMTIRKQALVFRYGGLRGFFFFGEFPRLLGSLYSSALEITWVLSRSLWQMRERAKRWVFVLCIDSVEFGENWLHKNNSSLVDYWTRRTWSWTCIFSKKIDHKFKGDSK